MVETGNHQQGGAPTTAPAPAPHNLGLSRGPTFAPAEQLLHLSYCITSNPSWHVCFILAFQHYIVMLGTTVLIASTIVPQMGGNDGDKARVIQVLLFMAGINTLLQTILGARLPTVMGPSFAFIISVLSTVRSYSDRDFPSNHEKFLYTMRTVQGSLIVSSFINIVLGYSGAWENIMRLFSPISTLPVVCLVGLGLFMRGFPQLGNCIQIGLPMLILSIVSQQYSKVLHEKAHHVLQRFGLLFCIALVWVFATILTAAGAYNNARAVTKQSCRTDQSHLISSAPWIKIPYPFHWGAPVFKASHVFGMMGAALVSSAESTGAYFAAARLSGATPPPPHVIGRSVGFQGVGMLLDGMFGALVGNTAAVENVGLLGLTHIGSRRVVQISTIYMIFFSIFGKFGAFFASIPLPIFSAMYCILFGIVAATGISFIQFTNSNSIRNIYVLGLSLFLGLSISQYFVMNTGGMGKGLVDTNSGWFDDILNTIFSSAPMVAIIVGLVLDNTLDAKSSAHERGIPWWKPFLFQDGDMRSDEFYRLPLQVHHQIWSRFH